MANLRQGDKLEMEISGVDGNGFGFVQISTEYNASSVDKVFFVTDRAYRVKSITGRPTVAGTDASAVTAIVVKAASATAIGSGTTLMASTYNLKGTANTIQALGLTTTDADLFLAAGDALAVDFTGTLTAATGVITVSLAPR